MVEVLEPDWAPVDAPCCGSSDTFFQPVEFIRAHASCNGKRHVDVRYRPTCFSVIEAPRRNAGYSTLIHLAIDSYEREERMPFSGLEGDGSLLDQETTEKSFSTHHCAGEVGIRPAMRRCLEDEAQRHTQTTVRRSLGQNNAYFSEVREKLEEWADDMVLTAENALLETNEQIKALRCQVRQANTLTEQCEIYEKIQRIERNRPRERQGIFKAEDEIIEQHDKVIDSMEPRLTHRTETETPFTICRAVKRAGQRSHEECTETRPHRLEHANWTLAGRALCHSRLSARVRVEAVGHS